MFRRIGGWRLAEPTPKGIVVYVHNTFGVFTVYTIPLVWVESNETGFQSLNRRSRCSTRPSPFEVIASSLKTRFAGSGTARASLFWAQLHAVGSNLAVCLRDGPKLLGTVA